MVKDSTNELTKNHTLYNLANYSVEFDYRPKRRGGGTSLYIHSCLQYKSRDDLKLYGDNSGDVNSVFIRISKQSSKTKCNIIVGCIYRPPSFSLDIFNERLSILLNHIDSEHKYAYITGDFNCNTLPGCDSSISTDAFKNILFSSHFYPLINNVTRVTRHSASLLDNIYCNIPYIQTNTTPGILYCSISDHYGIFCVTDIPCTNNELKTFTRRDISLRKISKFNRCLKVSH